jgi:peptidoglycan/xylan/chitin deacetylase (PgdA/CDA1 family)
MADVLDELKRLDVTGTFFINGINIDYHPEYAHLLTRAEEEGHVVGHHTYNHEKATNRVEYASDGKPTKATLEWFEKEVEANVARAQKWLPKHGLRPFFRPPFLEIDEAMATFLASNYEIYVVQINSDTRDFEAEKTSQEISYFVTSNIYADAGDVDKNSWITLQHDKFVNTALAIPEIVSFGLHLGYKFVGIDECLNFPKETRLRYTPAPTITPCKGKPCEKSYQCRSEHGFCGTGTTFCDGRPQWVPRCHTDGTKLPSNCSASPCIGINECRSGQGWCGAGSDYCNEDSVWLPGCAGEIVTEVWFQILMILLGGAAFLALDVLFCIVFWL